MNVIGTALENLEKEYPNKSPKRIMRKFRRTIKKPPKKQSRKDRRFILSFAIAIFDVLLPEDIIDTIVKRIEPKARKRLLTVRILLLCLVVYHLSPEIKSYNDLIRELTIRLRHRLPKSVKTILSKSSFSYQLITRSPKILQDILVYLLNRIVEHTTEQVLAKGRYSVKAMDYSVFNLAPSLKRIFKTADNGNGVGKTQCRLHTVFDTIQRTVGNIFITDANTNEKKRFKELFEPFINTKPAIIWVCDLGYWAFWIMDYIMSHKHHFVFRLRGNITRTIIKVLDESKHDYLVRLGCPQSRKPRPMSHIVRLVACPQEGSEIYWYVTSLIDPKEFSAQDIRALYKSRWAIEIFFRDLKHVLEFQPLSQSDNGIEIEFYSALITYTFIRIITIDTAHEYSISSQDISFSETYQTVNSWLRKKHRLFSEAPVKMVREEYEALLEFIRESCINESAKKRLAKGRHKQKLLKRAA